MGVTNRHTPYARLFRAVKIYHFLSAEDVARTLQHISGLRHVVGTGKRH